MLRQKIIYILLLVVLGFIPYSTTLKNPYLWDDWLFIQNGNFIKRFSNARVFFSPKNYFKYTQDFTYRPVPFLIHIANYKLFNTKPVGHRITNVILHTATAVLIYFLVLNLVKNNFVAFISGLFFVVHPVNTEVVNMVSFVETQLSTTFFLAAFFCYLKSKENHATHRGGVNNNVSAERNSANESRANALRLHIFSVVSYFLALFSKETAITLPALIILYDLLTQKRTDIVAAALRPHYIPFFAVAVFYLVIRFFVFRHPTEVHIKYPGDSFITNIFTMLEVLPVYLGMIFYPVNLCMEYRLKIPHSVLEPQVILGLIFIVFFVIVSIYAYKKSKTVFFSLMWILITFLPTSNIIPMQNIVAERYLYLPLIGVCVLLALLTAKLGRRQLIAVYGIVGCIIILLATTTIIRNLDWKSDFVFYSKTLEQVPDSPGINSIMGLVWAKYKNYPKAFECVHKALELDPELLDGQGALATIYQDTGDYNNAVALYEKMVVEKKYTFHKAPFLSIGIIYKIKKEYQKAIENFNKALEFNPLSSLAYNHLAEICETQGDIDTATDYFRKSADINPDDYISLNALGTLLGQKGLHKEALKFFQKAVKLKPDSADIHFNIGYVYFLTYEYGKALKELETTLKLDPNYQHAKLILTEIIQQKK